MQLVIPVEVAVSVPVLVDVAAAGVGLDEPDTALDQSSCHQATPAEPFGPRIVESVDPLGIGRLAREVHGLRGRALHPEGQLVAADPGHHLGIVRARGPGGSVEPGQEVELVALLLGRNLLAVASGSRSGRAAGAGTEYPDESCRHEAGTPVPRGPRSVRRGWSSRTMVSRGKVAVNRPQAICHPGAQTRVSLADESRIHLEQPGAMARRCRCACSG